MNINDKGQWRYLGGINPRPVPFASVVDAAPHAETVRLTYTVPNSMRAVLLGAIVSMRTTTDPTAAGDAECLCKITRVGNVAETLLRIFASAASGMIIQPHFLNFILPLNAGDKIEMSTVNGSTGGTVAHSLNASIIEFDVPR